MKEYDAEYVDEVSRLNADIRRDLKVIKGTKINKDVHWIKKDAVK